MPAYCTKAMWLSTDERAGATITYNGGEDRQHYAWAFNLDGVTVEKSNSFGEIHSGCGDDIDCTKALATLASFVGAWRESLERALRIPMSLDATENGHLFNQKLRPWADQYGEEFELWGYDYENPEEAE